MSGRRARPGITLGAASGRDLVRLFLVMVVVGGFVRRAVAADAPLRVVTLTTVLTEIVREVGGDNVIVEPLVGAGVDPHTFEPNVRDMRTIRQADLVLASGLDLEPYLERLAGNAGGAARLVRVGDTLPNVLSLSAADRVKDPHWWQSVDCVISATDCVRAELAGLRPAAVAKFTLNAEHYKASLLALKRWATQEMSQLPPDRRQLVTSHNAFGYFARDFGFTVHPISGPSPESEPTAKQLARLVDLVRREHIGAIFTENNVNPALVSALVEETGVRRGSALYADGLGPPGSGAETYARMYRHNVTAIVDGLR